MANSVTFQTDMKKQLSVSYDSQKLFCFNEVIGSKYTTHLNKATELIKLK